MAGIKGPKFIYGLADPRDGAVRYVGASKHPEKRLFQHLQGATSPSVRSWLEELKSAGLMPELRILFPSTDLWQAAEAQQRKAHVRTALNVHPDEGLTLDVRPGVAKALKALRTQKGLSTELVAESVNRTPTTIYRWEDGTRTPDLNDLAALAATYNVEPSAFLPTRAQIEQARRAMQRKGN